MRILSLLLLAILSCGIPHASAAIPKSSSTGVSDDLTFLRGTAMPSWIRPLADAPLTQRDDPVVLRLNEVQVRVATTPSVLRNRVIQVNERSSLPRIGQYAITYLPKHQKLYLHKVAILRGSQMLDRTASVNIRMLDREQGLEQGMYGGARTAQMLMDDVRVGDALWVVYTVEGENPVFGQIWSGQFAIEAYEPVELSRLTAMHAKDKPLYWRQLGDFRREQVSPVIETVGQQEILRFELRKVDAIEPEANISPEFFPLRAIQFSQYADWRGVAVWAYGLFPTVKGSGELDKLVASFRKAGTAEAQASAALQWVQDEVRYFSVSIGENSHRPAPPDVVLKRRFGDCKDKSYLLTSILNQLGIAARPVLVNAQARKVPEKVLPAPDWFDHAIVRLELNGQPYFVDPTRSSERGPISQRPTVLADGLGLIVDAGSKALVHLPALPLEQRSLDIFEKLSLPTLTGPGMLESSLIYRQHAAGWARQHYLGMSEREIRNELLAAVEKQYQGATLNGKPKLIDNEEQNYYQVLAEFKLPKPVIQKDGVYSIDYDSKILTGSVHFPGQVTRNFPLAIGRNYQRYRLQIDWPADVRTAGLLNSERISNAFFDAHQEYSILGNRTDLLLDFRVKASEVEAGAVPAFQADVKKLNPLMEASFRIPEGYVVQAEGRTLPLRHVAAVRNAIFTGERVRQLSATASLDDEDGRRLCNAVAAAVDLRAISPEFDRLLKDMMSGLERHTNERGVRRCIAMLDFSWGDFERALTYYEAEGELKDNDVLVDELAWSRLHAGDVSGALKAIERYVSARKREGTLSAYDLASALALYARAHSPVPDELVNAANEWKEGPWPRPLLAYQLGTLGEAELLAMAQQQGKDQRDRMLSDAWYYIAQQRYANKDADGARHALKWVAMHGIFGTPPMQRALGELWHADFGDQDFRNALIAKQNGETDKALKLFELAKKRNHAAAIRNMAHMYRTGDGVRKDVKRAVELFRTAVDLGDSNAANTLGAMYVDGEGVQPDQALALELIKKAAVHGDYYGSRNLGWRYRRGDGVKQDGALAQQYLIDAAELGNGEAQGELADVYLNGEEVPLDFALANYWAWRAIENGDSHGKAILGYLYAYGHGQKADIPRALALWQEAAKAGDVMAEFQLGLAYSKGRGVERDLRKARNMFESAATAGNFYARLYLEDLQMRNDPGESEAQRVITLFKAFAAGGSTEAAEFLRQYYLNGIGVAKDLTEAERWASVAAGKSSSEKK